MDMISSRIVEYVFFFGFMGVVGYLVWLMFAPFISALALAAIIVTICYPLYEWVHKKLPTGPTLAALVTTLFVVVVVILPVTWLTSLLVGEAISVYQVLDKSEITMVNTLENGTNFLESYIPGLELDVTGYLQQGAEWSASRLGVLFAGTASTIFSFFIAMIGAFYFFRDGKEFTKQLIRISPLPDDQDAFILARMATAVRSVATGTVMVAVIQGTLTAIGLTIAGFDRAILFGVIAAFGALIPGVGTTIVFLPAIIYLFVTGSYIWAVFLMAWGAIAVGLIDNLLGPYLISRGNAIHPFLILLSVLGGVGFFGPIGFIVGPVIVSLFIVLLELYSQHIAVE